MFGGGEEFQLQPVCVDPSGWMHACVLQSPHDVGTTYVKSHHVKGLTSDEIHDYIKYLEDVELSDDDNDGRK